MKRLMTALWQMLPRRHLLLIGGLLVVVIIIAWVSGGTEQTGEQLAPPPLPQVAMPAEDGQPSSEASVRLGNRLKLADHRPYLLKPGLQYPDNPEERKPLPEPVVDKPQPTDEPPRGDSHERQQKKPAATVATHHTDKDNDPPERPPVAEPKKPKASQPPPKPEKVVKQEQTRSSGLFAALPADAWLLQVATAGDKQRANAVCAKLTVPCVSYAAARHGKSVWVIVVGPYSSRQAAINGKAKLPSAMQARGPFPRKVSDVRQDAQ